ncbi:hypothetical protein ACFVYG_33555 [Streptomyces sp. NPDC058256]|uniref:hypothetical protein n=1 Tax=Streptomyces sp. NPDC058256 TaxID=3346408 RepID=UPI0036E6D2C8
MTTRGNCGTPMVLSCEEDRAFAALSLSCLGAIGSVRLDWHALRHFYASVLLDAWENITAAPKYLGHSDLA